MQTGILIQEYVSYFYIYIYTRQRLHTQRKDNDSEHTNLNLIETEIYWAQIMPIPKRINENLDSDIQALHSMEQGKSIRGVRPRLVPRCYHVVHRQRRYGDAARARRRESWSNQKDERCGHDAEELMAPMVTKPTLPDGMCLPTG